MEFLLDPPHGVGPLRLGMTPDEARTALETYPGQNPPPPGGVYAVARGHRQI